MWSNRGSPSGCCIQVEGCMRFTCSYLAVDTTVIYIRGLGGSWGRNSYTGLLYFCAVAPGRGTAPPETALGIARAPQLVNASIVNLVCLGCGISLQA